MLSNLSWCCACTLEIPQSGPRIKALLRKNVELRAPLEHLKGKLIERVIEESRRLRRNANGESADDADGKHAHGVGGDNPCREAEDGAGWNVDAACADHDNPLGEAADGIDFIDHDDPFGLSADPACWAIVETCRPKLHRKWAKMATRLSKRTKKKLFRKSIRRAMKTCWPQALAGHWTLGALKQEVLQMTGIDLNRKFQRMFHKLMPRVLQALKSKRGRPRKNKSCQMKKANEANAWRETVAMHNEDGWCGRLLAMRMI